MTKESIDPIRHGWLNTEDAAELLGVKPQTIHRHVRLGNLDPTFIPGSNWFHEDDLNEFAEGRRFKPGRPPNP